MSVLGWLELMRCRYSAKAVYAIVDGFWVFGYLAPIMVLRDQRDRSS
jgi:hypothetical protein